MYKRTVFRLEHEFLALAVLFAYAIYPPIDGILRGNQRILMRKNKLNLRAFAHHGIGLNRNASDSVLYRIDVQTGNPRKVFRRIGIYGIPFGGFVFNPAYTATELVAVHAHVERRDVGGHIARITTDMQTGIIGGCDNRISVHQTRVDILPVARSGVNLPIERHGRTRSGYLKIGYRAVANRNRLGLVQDAYIGIDFHQYRIIHHTTPRFGKRYLVAGGGTRLNRHIASRTGTTARRPFIFGFRTTAHGLQRSGLTQIDTEMIGRNTTVENIQIGFILYNKVQHVGNLGTAIHTMDTRYQQHTNAVAILYRIQRQIIPTALQYGVFVV